MICDMWNRHHCVSAERRVRQMAPRMNQMIESLRARGALIIHAPSGCTEHYASSPARERAQQAPRAEAPVRFDWNERNPDREPALPPEIADHGPCSCHEDRPCCTGEPPYPWSGQIEILEISDSDAITDDGQEVFNLIEARQIDDVLVMGVHTNICVLARPFGIRQLVYLGKRPVLCRDLTDSFHRQAGPHLRGTQLVIEHIERYWCPTISSSELDGGKPFEFADG